MAEGDRPIRPDRVAIYIRWSTDEQADGTTLAEQREGCEFYLRAQGWMVNPSLIFVDDGYSGGSLDRPGITRLRELVRQEAVDCVVVLKIDRLSRNIVDATHLVLDEWQGRCYLRCVRQPIDTTAETGRMFFAILATFADFERAQITERTYQGRIRRLREGRAYGGAVVPFGLLPTGEPGVRKLDPVRAPVVAELFRLAAVEGATPSMLLEWLAARGIAPPGGGRWSANTLRRILTNPIYTGRIVYGRWLTQPNSGPRRRRSLPTVDTPATTVPAIVNPALFAAVQQRLAGRSLLHRRHHRIDAAHLLTGIAYCRCGAPINVHWSRGIRYYWCSRRITHGASGCTAGSGCLQAAPVEQRLIEDLLTTFDSSDQRQAAAALVCAETSRGRVLLEQQLTQFDTEIDRLQQRLVTLETEAALGNIPLPEWRTLRTAAQTKLAELTAQRATLQNGLTAQTAALSPAQLVDRVTRLDRWQALLPQEQKDLLRGLIKRLELYKPRGRHQPYEIHASWRFGP